MTKFRKVDGVDMWIGVGWKLSFIITCNESGYTASYKDREYTGKQGSHFIEGSPFLTYTEAETACEMVNWV